MAENGMRYCEACGRHREMEILTWCSNTKRFNGGVWMCSDQRECLTTALHDRIVEWAAARRLPAEQHNPQQLLVSIIGEEANCETL